MLASLALIDIVRPRGLPPAHVGVEAGPMIYDEGDYFGRSVNMAARLASQAGADQVFVGEGLVSTVVPSGFRLVEVGLYSLKGFSRPVTIHQAIRRGRLGASRQRTTARQSPMRRTTKIPPDS